MISRIRLDAVGSTADYVSRTLYDHADEIERLLGVSVSRGECVIERDLTASLEYSSVAFKGRLLLYPDMSSYLKGESYSSRRVGAEDPRTTSPS